MFPLPAHSTLQLGTARLIGCCLQHSGIQSPRLLSGIPLSLDFCPPSRHALLDPYLVDLPMPYPHLGETKEGSRRGGSEGGQEYLFQGV